MLERGGYMFICMPPRKVLMNMRISMSGYKASKSNDKEHEERELQYRCEK